MRSPLPSACTCWFVVLASVLPPWFLACQDDSSAHAERTGSSPARSGGQRSAQPEIPTGPARKVGLLVAINRYQRPGNREKSGGRDDSVLTAAELATMDLKDCELAVLSACQTNVGPRYFGEAVTGLNRALQLAGARYTITSLWKVDDEGTATLFEEFYKALWQEGLSVPRAFDKARARAIELGYGPGVWAGFVLYVTGTEE